ITLYFTFPFSVIISARVLYALSCPIVSKPRHTSSQHPSSSTSSTHTPNSMPPPFLQCHQGSAKMPSRPQIQKSGTCALYVHFLLLLLLLPVCPHVPTHLPLLHQTQHSQHQLRA
ncbi:hypothetical protein SMMN14_01490, partial [Sphaerulina musiva]